MKKSEGAHVHSLRFFTDEDVPHYYAAALSGNGIDTVTCSAAKVLGLQDEDILQHATALGRAVITRNVRDFVLLHKNWMATNRTHGGIVLVTEQRIGVDDFVTLVQGLMRCHTETLTNQALYLANFKGP